MAVTQSGTSVAGDKHSANRGIGLWRIGLWTMAVVVGLVTVGAIVLGLLADSYQPLGMWNQIGGFPGLHRAEGERTVNDFGAQTGQLYIPHQRRAFAASVSLVNSGTFPVTIEDVSMQPPHLDRPWSMVPAGPALYWTGLMISGTPDAGRPIAGLQLKPGNVHGIFVAVPVRTPRCYIAQAFQVLDHFYVKERFGPFTKWVRIPLSQPLLINAPAEPANQPGPGTICPGR